MKKWIRWGIGFTCAIVVSIGVLSAASVSKADEVSLTVTGTVHAIDFTHRKLIVTTDDSGDNSVSVSKMVCIVLDNRKAQLSDLGTGYKVQLILNNKKQASYIRAVSIRGTDKPDSSPATSAEAAVPWVNLHLKMESSDLNAEIYDNGDDLEGTSLIKMTNKDRDGFLLKGDSAENWIRTLLAGVDLSSPNTQQQVTEVFSNWFDLKDVKLNVKVGVEAKPLHAHIGNENETATVTEAKNDAKTKAEVAAAPINPTPIPQSAKAASPSPQPVSSVNDPSRAFSVQPNAASPKQPAKATEREDDEPKKESHPPKNSKHNDGKDD